MDDEDFEFAVLLEEPGETLTFDGEAGWQHEPCLAGKLFPVQWVGVLTDDVVACEAYPGIRESIVTAFYMFMYEAIERGAEVGLTLSDVGHAGDYYDLMLVTPDDDDGEAMGVYMNRIRELATELERPVLDQITREVLANIPF